MPFACYVTDQEFYAKYDIAHWIPHDTIQRRLRDAALEVADDLRSRDVNISRLMVPIMLTGGLYEVVTKTANWQSAEITGAYNASRFIVDVRDSSASSLSFGLRGSMDGATWVDVLDVQDGIPLSIVPPGIGLYSVRFFEKYERYRMSVTTDASVSFTAYLVDSSVDNLIIWKAIQNGMYPLLDKDTRSVDLYDTARSEYNDAIANMRADIDEDGDNAISSGESNLRHQPLLFR